MGSLDGGAWHHIFIPTHLQYLASREVENAWAIDDDDTASTMQKIWDYTYGTKVPYKVTTVGSVFFIVSTLVLCSPHTYYILSRLISMPVSGVVGLVLLHLPFSKCSSSTTKLTQMMPVRNLWSLLLITGHSSIVKSTKRMERWVDSLIFLLSYEINFILDKAKGHLWQPTCPSNICCSLQCNLWCHLCSNHREPGETFHCTCPFCGCCTTFLYITSNDILIKFHTFAGQTRINFMA
jgi:hypothetical protein